MSYRKRPGTWAKPGKIKVPNKNNQSVNAEIRRILTDELLPLGETLMKAWGYTRIHSAYQRMYRRHELFTAQEISKFCDTVGITGPERKELHLKAAREWGFEV